MSLLPLFFLTGLAAGTVDAIAGGGGLISLPMLLSLGLPPQLALGTNKFQSFFGTSIAAFSYYRRGWLNRAGLLRGIAFTAFGSCLGVIATQLSSNAFLKQVIPFLLMLVFVYMLFCPRLGQQDQKPRWNLNLFCPVIGIALGFYDGFLGPGAGGFWVFFLMYLLGYNLLKATAYTKIYNLTSNVVAVTCFIMIGNIDYRIGLCMGLGQVLGGRLGALFAMTKGAKLVRPLFLTMMLMALVMLIYRNESPWKGPLQFGFSMTLMGAGLVYFWRTRKAKALQENG